MEGCRPGYSHSSGSQEGIRRVGAARWLSQIASAWVSWYADPHMSRLWSENPIGTPVLNKRLDPTPCNLTSWGLGISSPSQELASGKLSTWLSHWLGIPSGSRGYRCFGPSADRANIEGN